MTKTVNYFVISLDHRYLTAFYTAPGLRTETYSGGITKRDVSNNKTF